MPERLADPKVFDLQDTTSWREPPWLHCVTCRHLRLSPTHLLVCPERRRKVIHRARHRVDRRTLSL